MSIEAAFVVTVGLYASAVVVAVIFAERAKAGDPCAHCPHTRWDHRGVEGCRRCDCEGYR